MEFKTEMVPLKEMLDAYSMVSISDVYETLQKYLDRAELQKYCLSGLNVMMGAKLSRSETILLNKVDEITMREHGMCLKDSAVTKARLKACIRYGIKFIDRDGLVDHMKLMQG